MLKRWAKYASGISAVLLVATAAICWFLLRNRAVSVAGRKPASGLAQAVEVVRDRYAIPHIYAASEMDAYFALGYVHAQDRLWQMELARRVGSGSLAEVFGVDALPRDRLFRTLGLRRVAEANLAHLSEDARAALEAYARGVNARLADSTVRLPLEFSLFRFEPRAWSAVDSLVVLKLMAYTLSANFSRELLRLRLAKKLGPERLAEFLQDPFVLPEFRLLYGSLDPGALSETVTALAALSPANRQLHLGSNNWVVNSERSVTGKPLLANDPHLDLSAPTLWYLAHLHSPQINAVGATIPGLPTVVLGRTPRVAWSFTNTESDTQDLFIERLASDHSRYEAPGGSRPFVTRREVIHVKGLSDEVLEVRSTRHGPVVSDVSKSAAGLTPSGHVLALSWVALDEGDTTFQFSLRAGRAQSSDDLRAAARDFHSPQQNIVYADDAGQVGFVAAGRVPVRRADNEIKGLVPVPGWLEKYDWQGSVPFDELPQLTNTPYIVTANNDITPESYQHWLGAEWATPYRANRIAQLLENVPKHNLNSFARIQLDVRSGTAEALLPFLRQLDGADERERDVLAALSKWNGEMAAERSEPLIFSTWVRELTRAIYADELGELFTDVWGDPPDFLRNVLSNRGGLAHWCDDVTTPNAEDCAQVSLRALRSALLWLSQRCGSSWQNWRWGAQHRAHSKHSTLGDVPLLGNWVNIVKPVPGDNETINLAGYSLDEDEAPFASHHGPGLRALYDLANPENSLFITSTGQSGDPLSPHYRDMSALWARGEYVPMRTGRASIEAGALGTLVLVPQR
ncbi:MAG: penicillin acylase family protein [Myxococcota bacterium]